MPQKAAVKSGEWHRFRTVGIIVLSFERPVAEAGNLAFCVDIGQKERVTAAWNHRGRPLNQVLLKSRTLPKLGNLTRHSLSVSRTRNR